MSFVPTYTTDNGVGILDASNNQLGLFAGGLGFTDASTTNNATLNTNGFNFSGYGLSANYDWASFSNLLHNTSSIVSNFVEPTTLAVSSKVSVQDSGNLIPANAIGIEGDPNNFFGINYKSATNLPLKLNCAAANTPEVRITQGGNASYTSITPTSLTTENIYLSQNLYDSSNNSGLAGQILTSNGSTGTYWSSTPIPNNYFYDEQWAEASSENGLLGFRMSNGTSTMAVAEANHYGIVRFQTPASNSYGSWTMRSPLLWSNISYVEMVFRGWFINTSTNTSLNIGLLSDITAANGAGIFFQYSSNIAPTGVWNLRVNGTTVGSLTATGLTTQLVGTWCKVRIENTSDTGSYSATFTRLDTNQTQTLTGTGLTIGTQMFCGGLITCVSGGVVKVCDMDSVAVQLK